MMNFLTQGNYVVIFSHRQRILFVKHKQDYKTEYSMVFISGAKMKL